MYRVVQQRTPSEEALALVQREYPQYHPLMALARLAHDKRVVDDPKLELAVHQTILPYVQPKLSSVEVQANISDHRRVVVTLFEDIDVEDGTVIAEVPLSVDRGELVPLDN
jgi:hypothetical protein